jgi:hypothetical protein
MASSFPGAIDSFTDPLSGSALNSPSHSAQHADLNDAAEKLETYMGLVKVIPTSVAGTGVTVSATGTITYSASTTIDLKGIFSSLYDVYRIVISNHTSSLAPQLQGLMLSGATPLTTSTYETQRAYVQAGAAGGTGTAGTPIGYGYIGYTRQEVNGGAGYGYLEIANPFLARYTAWISQVINQYAYIEQNSAIVKNTTSYDGFRIQPDTGTISGSLRVYGYRN